LIRHALRIVIALRIEKVLELAGDWFYLVFLHGMDLAFSSMHWQSVITLCLMC
jgi:hypothetical protein